MHWLVNSYGYPNPFGSSKAILAWRILLTFAENHSLSQLKIAWQNGTYDKMMSASGIGSWKASFEEFGLLYVETRTDLINITPNGKRFIEAGKANDEQGLFEYGIASLLRYPLKGPPSPPRPSRGVEHKNSDILPYWLLYAMMLELDGRLYRKEIDNIISRIFSLSEVEEAVTLIRKLRAGELDYSITMNERELASHGKFYNTMNQIVVHASMNYLVWNQDVTPYPHTNENTKVYTFVADKKDYIIQQMGGLAGGFECEEKPSFLARVPEAPAISSELDYFAYLGMNQITTGNVVKDPLVKLFNGTNYSLLVSDVNYKYVGPLEISGTISQLCRLSIGQDLVLSHDTEKWLYKVDKKIRKADGTISIILRTGKPILNKNIIKSLFDNDDN